jgi:hypothetical protein
MMLVMLFNKITEVFVVKKLRRILFDIWMFLPFGYLLRFEYGSRPGSCQRVTLCKSLWVIIDGGKGTAKDALPLNLVSQQLVDECEKRLVVKYGLDAAGA